MLLKKGDRNISSFPSELGVSAALSHGTFSLREKCGGSAFGATLWRSKEHSPRNLFIHHDLTFCAFFCAEA